VRGIARGVGNPVIYVGAKTGRDGIHGVSLLASAEFDQSSSAKRPTVQVGDPFLEKLVMEACLEIAGNDALVGMQDMGGAGLTCATSEMAAKGGVGMRVDLDRVPVRETGMNPYELLLSESQDRMLLVARRGREHEILRVFSRWGLDAVVIGEVTEGPWLEYYRGGALAARVPAKALADEAPIYQRPVAPPPEWQNGSEALAEKLKLEAALLARDLTHRAEIEAIKVWTWRQCGAAAVGSTAEVAGIPGLVIICLVIRSFRDRGTEDVFDGADSVVTVLDSTASGSTTGIGSAFGGRLEMPTKSKSRITIKRGPAPIARPRGEDLVTRRLPRDRPPTHPGEMLLEEFIKPLGITQTDLAARLGISFPRLNEVIRGKRSVTPDTALRLARVLGMPADFWLGLQLDWDLWHAKRGREATKIAELEPLRTSP